MKWMVWFSLIVLFNCLPVGVQAGVVIQTGQTRCYDADGTEIDCTGTGQDGEIRAGVEWPESRFAATGDCMVDQLTGLMWSKSHNLAAGPMTWNDALHAVAALNRGAGMCGHRDWRLPNIKELLSIVNYGDAYPLHWLVLEGFENFGILYWSSTTHEAGYYGPKLRAWDLFDWGVINHNPKTETLAVWPVRTHAAGMAPVPRTGQTVCYNSGGYPTSCSGTGQDGEHQAGAAWPEPRFLDNGDGSITDALTGLTWAQQNDTPGPQVCGSHAEKTWLQALEYVRCLNDQRYLGRDRWRMPNINELLSLVDFSRNNPAIPADHLFDSDINCRTAVWTSTTRAAMPHMVWSVQIPQGWTFFSYDKKSSLHTWPVCTAGAVPKGPGAMPFLPLLLNED